MNLTHEAKATNEEKNIARQKYVIIHLPIPVQ